MSFTVDPTIPIAQGKIYEPTPLLRWNGDVLEQAWYCRSDNTQDWRPVPRVPSKE